MLKSKLIKYKTNRLSYSFSVFLFSLLCFMLLSPAIVLASYNTVRIDLSDPYKKQRSLFLKAEMALNKKHYKTYAKYYAELDQYPLQSYLKYKEYRKKLARLTEKQVLSFLQEYNDTPYENWLRIAWLKHKAKHKQWQQYLNAYTPQKDTARQCHYVNALLQTGNSDGKDKQKATQTAFAQVPELWLKGKSQPESCDPVFKAFTKAGKMTPELLWGRIKLAMKKGQTSLATYLARSLSNTDQHWVKEWIRIYRKPALVLNSKLLKQQHPVKTTILVHAVERTVSKQPKSAAKLITTLEKENTFTPAEQAQMYRSIGMKLAYHHKPGAWNWLDKIADDQSDETVRQWRARSAIREGNWEAINTALKRLSAEEQKDFRWQYWAAAVQEQNGLDTEAQKNFSQLANNRSYYSFLAADKMDMPYEFNDIPLTPDSDVLEKIAHNQGILRAREFYLLDRTTEARREWYFTTRKQMDKKDRAVAAKVAQQWGWYNRAIITTAYTDNRNDIDLRFPVLQEDQITKYSKKQNLQPAYTMAVIRRESAFAIDARSKVGALGLMQIMPATGKVIAGKLKVKYKNKNQLLNPDTNVKFGTKYLNMMLKKFYKQPALASAAYNAGGHRVNKWLPENTDMQADRWVETIPFTETREYVSSILAYTAIYEHQLGLPQTRLNNNMPDVPKKK